MQLSLSLVFSGAFICHVRCVKLLKKQKIKSTVEIRDLEHLISFNFDLIRSVLNGSDYWSHSSLDSLLFLTEVWRL